MTNEFIALLANIALTLSVIVAVIFGIAQVKSAKKDRRERLTLQMLTHFQTRQFAETLHYMHRTKFPATYQEWEDMPNEDQVQFVHFSQEMESLGILLAEGLIDLNLIDKTLGSFVTDSWEKYKPVMADMREKNNDPYLSEYFQWMAEQIEQRIIKKRRKPFFLSKGRL